MKIWTIQPWNVWDQLQEFGELRTDLARMRIPNFVPDCYEWLRSQLGYATYPWWAYAERPDLRCYRYTSEPGIQVRMKLELAEADMCVFPLWAWDQVYCGHYLARQPGELEEWETAAEAAEPAWLDLRPDLPEPFGSQLVASWQHLFSPHLPRQAPFNQGFFCASESRVVVFEVLRMEQVQAVTFFDGIVTPQRRRRKT